MSLRENLRTHSQIAFGMTALALAIVIGTWFIHYNQRALEAQVRTMITDESVYLTELADVIDRNGADDVIAAAVNDCTRRSEYEALLVRLASLNMKELLTVQMLSESCGDFYPERKALMVAKLDRELVHYRGLIDLLGVLSTHDTEAYQVALWEEIVTLERSRSAMLTDQKNIQAEIISALISGESVQSAHVTDLVREAQELGELLVVYDKNVDEKRKLIE